MDPARLSALDSDGLFHACAWALQVQFVTVSAWGTGDLLLTGNPLHH